AYLSFASPFYGATSCPPARPPLCSLPYSLSERRAPSSAVVHLVLVRPMKPLVTSLLYLLLATVHAAPDWENKVIGDIRIGVPTGCKKDVQNTSGTGGAV